MDHLTAMVIKFAHPLILALAVGLSACTPAPEGFVEAPKVAEYFQNLIPTAGKNSVELVSICPMDGPRNDRWATSILFEDGNLYHYEYSIEHDAVELHHHTTESQRKDNAEHYTDEPDDCVWANRRPGGSYRFNVGKNTLRGYVYERIVVNKPFDAEVQKHLKESASAVQAAIQDHAKFTPVETSWGLKP